MGFVVLAGGLAVIAAAATLLSLWSERGRADARLQTFAAAVPAPLTPEVAQWLRPQLARRTTYPFVGGVWGLAAAHIPLTPGWQEVPWYWFAGLIGLGAGTATGALLAGYRTVPLVDGPARTADAVRRRVADQVGRPHALRLRLAVVVAAVALALAGVVAASHDGLLGRQVLVACGLGAVLVAAHHRVASTVVARPLVASTRDGLVWQKALLAKTVEPLPGSAFAVALVSVAIALYATVAAHQDLAWPVLSLGACVALLAVGCAAVALLAGDHPARWAVRAPRARVTP